MKLSDFINYFDTVFPFSYQESYDNSGLIIGLYDQEISGALITLDIIEEVVQEAIEKKCNLIISHHPIIFSGIKKLSSNNSNDRAIILAIQNKISIIALHTNLDNSIDGINGFIAKKLELKNISILQPTSDSLCKLVTFCPVENVAQVREAMFSEGAGAIGNYDNCSYNTSGEGTFRALNDANPFVGEKNIIHFQNEIKIEVIVPVCKIQHVVSKMKSVHPYEEVAYDVIPLKNQNPNQGAGIIGTLNEPIEINLFLNNLKNILGIKVIRHSKLCKQKISKIAYCGGSGSFLIKSALTKKADIFITGDIKYHDFFLHENRLIIADIGHFESEFLCKDIIFEILTKKFPNFAVLKSEIDTNPIQYFV